ncbi:THAP domain-containing protein 5-like isoform 2-T2 [Aulostomus maculatus]
MRRDEWTPSRHQYLCSEHFTEDCFDIRWGIRYLKNTAIPTIFPPAEDDADKLPVKRISKPKSRICDIEPLGSEAPLCKRPLILSRICKKVQSGVAEHTQIPDPTRVGGFELPLVSDASIICPSDLPDGQTPGDGGSPATFLALSSCSDGEERANPFVRVLCCDSKDTSSAGEADIDVATLQPAMDQTFSFVTVDVVNEKPVDGCLGERCPDEVEHTSVYEHSYCRMDTDKDQLWSKILSLHGKILELDHREESTVAKIRALETEIALLKRDSAVFKEKQKVLEEYISSVVL